MDEQDEAGMEEDDEEDSFGEDLDGPISMAAGVKHNRLKAIQHLLAKKRKKNS